MKIKINPSPLPKVPSKIKSKGKIAMKIVKIAEFWINLLSAEMPPLATKVAKAMAKVKSRTFDPTTSPKESWGILWRTEEIPTKRLGIEVAKAIIKKATTNSRHPKNLAIRIKASISHLPTQNSKKQEVKKIEI